MDEEIDFSKLSTRSSNLLGALGITKVSQLTKMTSNEVMKYRNVGRHSLTEIRKYLASKNLTLKDDLLITDEAIRKIILSVPDTINNILSQISEINRTLSLLEDRLTHIHLCAKEKQ